MTADATLLLGCGSVGRAVARLLGRDRAFGRVIVADRCLERATAAAELCNGKANSLTLDCTDYESLNRVLEDVALVVNTVELPLDSLLPMIRSVVEAGVSYTDANDDPESLQAVFDSEYLASLAGYRGVSVIPGMGVSPGQTNAMTSYLGQRLNRVDEARFIQVDDLSRRRAKEWRKRLAAFGSPALVWRESDWRHVSPMSECGEAALPPPWGSIRCCTVGLQAVTLPANLPSLTDVSNHRGFAGPDFEEVMRDLVRYGFAGDQPVGYPGGGTQSRRVYRCPLFQPMVALASLAWRVACIATADDGSWSVVWPRHPIHDDLGLPGGAGRRQHCRAIVRGRADAVDPGGSGPGRSRARISGPRSVLVGYGKARSGNPTDQVRRGLGRVHV